MAAQAQSKDVVPITKQSLLVDMAARYSMEPHTFANALKATVVPANISNEQFAAFLMAAKEYNLNPLLKEIYAFPKPGGGIQIIVPIDGWVHLANANPNFDGLEFDDHLDNGKLEAITARIWRKDRRMPVVVTEYMAECARSTDTWKQWPRRMLRHKALIQCARYAFGFSGIVDPDEAERETTSVMKTVSDGPPTPPAHMTDAELVASGRDDGKRVVMGEKDETEIAPFDESAWLNTLNAELSFCDSALAVSEVQREIMMPEKPNASAEAWAAAEDLVRAALERL